MKIALAALSALVLVLPARAEDDPNRKAAPPDPVGTWQVTRTWFAGTKDETKDEFTLTLTRDGGRLLGRATWPNEEPPIRPGETRFEATYLDGTLSFRTGQGQHVGDYSGTLEGDTLKGSMAVFIVTGTWEAKRVADEKRDAPKGKLAALEQKLVGAWVGQGPCDGTFVFRADGTYVLTGHGPGGDDSEGTWRVRWDALPPTLVLTNTASANAERAGRVRELRLLKLDDKNLVVGNPNPDRSPPGEYVRDGKPKPEGVKPAKVTEAELHGAWQSEVDGVFEQSTLELRPGGHFRLEHRDFALGWTTTLTGRWELKGARLTLTVRDRLHDGRPVPVGEKKTEELSAVFRCGGWALSQAHGPEVTRATTGE